MTTPRWRRWLGPSAVSFVLALVMSLVAHFQAFVGLGVLSLFMQHAARPPDEPVQIAFGIDDGAPVGPAAQHIPDEPDVTTGDVAPDAPPRPVRRVTQPPSVARPRTVVERPTPRQATPPAPESPRETQHVQPDQRQSITQHSDDPSVPPPPDARFLARENRHVEEETVASVRNVQRDDADPSAGRTHQSPDTQEGNADDSVSADLRTRDGSDARHVTPREAEQDRPRHADDTPPPNVVARGDNAARGRDGVPSEGTDSAARDVAGRAATAGGGTEVASTPIVVSDGQGTWTVRVPQPSRTGVGDGTAGGRAAAGTGLALSDDEGGRGAGGRAGARGSGRGTGASGVDLRIAWSTFEETFTPEQLRADRERYLAERRSRARGSSHAQDWQAFRAAIENYVPGVRPGNQTALNAAASPFADYLAEVHRRLHREFAERFLPSLPSVSDNPFADRSLMTKLEIVLERDGRIHRIGVVESSGYTPYDFGAFEAVMRGQPYPEAPDAILSGDGRVYVRWAFYRNERQCGTFNAEPYILPHPPDEAGPAHGPLIDRPEPGGIIPRGARPAGAPPGPADEPRPPVHGLPSDVVPANGG